jgi:hypothetical protein
MMKKERNAVLEYSSRALHKGNNAERLLSDAAAAAASLAGKSG